METLENQPSKEATAVFIDKDGTICPFCGTCTVEPFDLDCNQYECTECGAMWIEIRKLLGLEVIYGPDDSAN